MYDLLTWIIAITGIISLTFFVIKALNKEDTPLILLLQKINVFTIKIASFAAIILLIYLRVVFMKGIIKIQDIGFYIACIAILYSFIKDVKVNYQFLENVSTIITSKTKDLEQSIAEQAQKAKEKTVPPKDSN
jgi:choline-glycine betaine transporter